MALNADHHRTPAPCLIRQARLDELARINTLVLRSKASWGYTDHQMARWRADLHIDESAILRGAVYVAELQDVLVGMFVVEPSPDNPELTWQLAHFFVCPDYFGRRIGSALFAYAVDLAHRHDVHAILIDADPNAERFYWQQGARRSGTVAAPSDTDPARSRPQMVLSLIEIG